MDLVLEHLKDEINGAYEYYDMSQSFKGQECELLHFAKDEIGHAEYFIGILEYTDIDISAYYNKLNSIKSDVYNALEKFEDKEEDED